jgi:hypothetical protein
MKYSKQTGRQKFLKFNQLFSVNVIYFLHSFLLQVYMKAFPLHATHAPRGREGTAPTH